MDSLRKWNDTHIEEEVCSLEGHHEDELFYGCRFQNLAKATLKNCCLSQSKLDPQTIRDIAGVTFTANCHTFAGLEMNETAFDLMLMLLLKTKGNDKKRQAIVDHVLGRERVRELLNQMKAEFE